MSFYSILPSNSCPLTQPDNTANSYIVDWPSTIDLPGKWKVALTEYTICDFSEIIPYPFTIDYKILIQKKRVYIFEISEGTFKTANISSNDAGNINFKIYLIIN